MLCMSFWFILRNFKYIKSGRENEISHGFEILYEEYKTKSRIYNLLRPFFMVRIQNNNVDEENCLLTCTNSSY